MTQNLLQISSQEKKLAIERLRKKLNSRRSELLGLLEKWHMMITTIQSSLLFKYENIFGELEYRLQNKTTQAKEIERKIELLTVKYQRGEKLTTQDIDQVNRIVEIEFKRYRTNQDSKIAANQSPDKDSNNGFKSFNTKSDNYSMIMKNDNLSSEDLSKLYRSLVKKLHPDVCGNIEEYCKYWDNIQVAYKSGNLHRLSLFHKLICETDNAYIYINHDDELTALRKEMKEIDINIATETRRIERLKKEEPYSIEKLLDDDDWIATRKTKLNKQIISTDREIEQNTAMLNELTHQLWKDKNDPNQDPAIKFKQDFISDTYFNNR